MKRLSLTPVLTAAARVFGIVSLTPLWGMTIPTQPSLARPAADQRGFWCETSSEKPVTMYQNGLGQTEPWIEWVSDYFSSSGWDPVTRCQEVSARLETYRRNRQLKFITIGTMNNQNVICTASQVGGACQGLIYTLKPKQDPETTLYNFLAWREGQTGKPSLSESPLDHLYIDVTERLGEDINSVEQPPVNLPFNREPAPQQPDQSGMREL